MPFAGLRAALEEAPDSRRPQGRRYPLARPLPFSVPAVLAGAASYRGIRVSIGVHRERLNATLGAALRRAPAVNAARALFQALDPAALEAAFRRHAGEPSDAAPAPGPRVSSRSTARRSGAASTICTTGRPRTCRAPSPARPP